MAQSQQLVVQLQRCRRNRGATYQVVAHHELAVEGIHHRHAGLAADQQSTQVVPHPVLVVAEVDEPVEHAIGHGTQVERAGAHRPKLPPTGLRRGQRGDHDDRVVETSLCRRLHRATVAERSPTPLRPEPHATRLVDHDGGEHAVAVDQAQRRGIPRDALAGIGAAVEWIDHHHPRPVGMLDPTLLRQHANTCRPQNREGSLVGHQVGCVLVVADARGAPVSHPTQGRSDCVSNVVQHSQRIGRRCVHHRAR